jgi:hypothetical protein
MSDEERRLSELLKRTVPEPPFQLSADRITTRAADLPARPWLVPAMAAAAVLVIGATVGAIAAHHAGVPTGPRPAPGQSVAAPATKSAGNGSPNPTASCHGATVIVPSVVGATQDAAIAVAQQAGLNVEIYAAVPPASQAVPEGVVFSQSLAAGTRAVPGAMLQVAVAMAKPASTAPPIDPGFAPTTSPSPMSPCQAVTGSPAAQDATEAVPNVTGMAQSRAVKVAQTAGFKVDVVSTAPPSADSVPPGTVFAQTPTPGSKARPGTGIILFVAPPS